jgi:hypothetical protein
MAMPSLNEALKAWISASVLLLALPLHAESYFRDGYELMQACNEAEALPSDKVYQRGECLGYVIGVMDALDTAGTLTGYTLKCEPSVVRAGQVKLVVQRYLEAHPQYLHRSASDIVASAVREAFPCRKTH